MTERPEHLPDFSSPPLDEVVIGVQFAPPSNYSSVFAKDVWELFKYRYPNVQEQPPLEPSFETFGGSNPQTGIKFHLAPAPLRGRLWFISNEQSHLIQFQEDRFLLNWRKRPNGQEYPHFESIADAFEAHLDTLQSFFLTSFIRRLDINQAEISYINIIPVESYSHAGEWLSFLDIQNVDLENINLQFTEVINDTEGKPYARLIHELQSVVTVDGKARAFKLSFTFRGKPTGKEISEAMTFIHAGREKIVIRFSDLTTKKAQSSWERIK